ncbi:MAG: hypothetical protein QW356_08840, partial [Candidatus Hadarchaeales archaeon]
MTIVPEFSDAPPELRELKRWICWREEWREGAKKPTKVPVAPWKGTTGPVNALDSANWTNFDEALKWAKRLGLGVGIVLGEVEPGKVLTGIDLDNVINEGGVVNPEAEEIIKKASSYTELSPSFRGIHVLGWLEGSLPRPLIYERGDFRVEIYTGGRWFTLTGRRWKETPLELGDLSLSIQELRLRYEEEPVGEFLKEDTKLNCVEVFKAMGGDLTKLKWTGDQFQGPHPVHGSTTMKNFTLHPTKGWHCFRHWRGGGPLSLAALMAGLIRCEEVAPGCLEGKMGEVVKILKEKGVKIETPKSGEEEKDRFSRAMEIAEHHIVELFLEEISGEAYATIKHERGGFVNLPIRGRGFDAWLNTIFYEVEGKGLREDVRKDVRATLEAKAFKSGKRKELQLLAAVNEGRGRIWVDLGSPSWSTFVEITPGAWRIINPPSPVPFKRTDLSAPLSVVERMVEGEECRRLLSLLVPPTVEEEVREDFTTFFPPYFCSLLLTHISRPGLLYLGPQGSSKTVMQRLMVRALTGGDVEKIGKSERDIAVKLENSPLVCFDNIRNLSPEIADLLSVAITGGLYTARRLYTDAETKILKLRRVILLNGISPNIFKYPDLVDRLVVIPLRRLTPEERKEEKVLLEEFGKLHPEILAAVFSSLARALLHLEKVRKELQERKISPRMCDFAIWGEAVARGMGYQPLEWLRAYLRLIQQTEEMILEENPLARAILRLAEELKQLERGELEKIEELPAEGKGWWIGTPSQFLHRLEEVMEEDIQELREEGFPANARSLGRKLRDLLPALQDQGVYLTFQRKPGGAIGKRERLVEVRVKWNKNRDDRDDRDIFSYKPPPSPGTGVKEERKEKEGEEGGGETDGKNVPNVPNVPTLSPPFVDNTPPREGGLWLVKFTETYPGGLVGSLPGEIPKGASRVLTGWEVGELRRKFGFVEVRKL